METQILAPSPGQDYPRTWNEFLDLFATEEACLAFLERLRWPDGFVCPRCTHAGDVYRASRTRLVCRACQYQGSVTSGTIFDKTRTPLRVWLAAAWYLTNRPQRPNNRHRTQKQYHQGAGGHGRRDHSAQGIWAHSAAPH